jgi:hypothetical protein
VRVRARVSTQLENGRGARTQPIKQPQGGILLFLNSLLMWFLFILRQIMFCWYIFVKKEAKK